MFSFAYEKPLNLEDALKILDDRKNAHILAGGTNLLLKIKHRQLKPKIIISFGRLEELQKITTKDGYIYIGSGVKINNLLKNKVLRENAPLLVRAAKEIGSPEIRNMATIGGNICSVGANCGACGFPGCRSLSGGGIKACKYASSADLIPPLMALGAGLLLVSSRGERRIPVQDFISAGGKINLQTGEILKEIYFKPQNGDDWGYTRLSTSKAMGITVVSVAAKLVKNENNTFSELSLALGGSFERPLKVAGINQLIKDKTVNSDLIKEIIDHTIQQLSYIENLEMSLDYRRYMTGVLIKEAIEQALGA